MTFDNFANFANSRTLTDATLRSLLLAGSAVLIASLVAWPIAYFVAFVVPQRRRLGALLVLLAPFWTSFAIRAFAWQLVLSDSGLVASALELITGRSVQLGFLYSFNASVFGLALFGTMLMTLTLYSTMIAIDTRVIEASSSLGARPWQTFRDVVVPLTLPGWIAGGILTFIVAVGDYSVPTLLGGGFRPVLAQVMISTVKGTYDISMASTIAVVLIFLVFVAAAPLAIFSRRLHMFGGAR